MANHFTVISVLLQGYLILYIGANVEEPMVDAGQKGTLKGD